MSHLQHGQVHANAPHDGCLFTANDHAAPVGEPSTVAVAVAHRNGGDGRGGGCFPCAAVADFGSGGNLLDVDDLGLELHGRMQVDAGLIYMGGGEKAVNRYSGSDHIEVGLGHIDDGAAVGGVF